MAAWQYQINLIPSKEIDERSEQFNNNIEEFLDNINGWNRNEIPEELISKKLLQSKSWSESILNWGKEDSNNIQFFIEENQAEEVTLRIDLREDVREMIELLISLASRLSASLINIDHKVVKCDFDIIVEDIKSSSSYSFVKNPASFLNSLK